MKPAIKIAFEIRDPARRTPEAEAYVAAVAGLVNQRLEETGLDKELVQARRDLAAKGSAAVFIPSA